VQESLPVELWQGGSLFLRIAMGILDEAIREHLELKRSHGATDSELQRMEDEAFGLPSRPGEPDFPEHEGGVAEPAGNGVAAEEPVTEAPAAPADDEPDQVSPAAEEPSAEAPAAQDPTALHDEAVEPDPGGVPPEAPPEEPAAAAEAPAAAEEPAPAEAPEAPIESLDTVEHPMPDQDVEDEASEERADEDGDEDVLADTPEFLKDAPEDDELWFEQGKPKDFDF
jgi:hypothetical protein